MDTEWTRWRWTTQGYYQNGWCIHLLKRGSLKKTTEIKCAKILKSIWCVSHSKKQTLYCLKQLQYAISLLTETNPELWLKRYLKICPSDTYIITKAWAIQYVSGFNIKCCQIHPMRLFAVSPQSANFVCKPLFKNKMKDTPNLPFRMIPIHPHNH